ncbi:hypothetical protein e1012e08.tmp0351 [Eimeria tenella]|uniref:Uncharacterized protein n=1 Tax=Eimeria tenella TaxID=5802 RepID=C8TDN2_EIMTE|nr:hypothetical protein e1012e08.tmp0351 [Eimeria tenella]
MRVDSSALIQSRACTKLLITDTSCLLCFRTGQRKIHYVGRPKAFVEPLVRRYSQEVSALFQRLNLPNVACMTSEGGRRVQIWSAVAFSKKTTIQRGRSFLPNIQTRQKLREVSQNRNTDGVRKGTNKLRSLLHAVPLKTGSFENPGVVLRGFHVLRRHVTTPMPGRREALTTKNCSTTGTTNWAIRQLTPRHVDGKQVP